LIDFLTTAQLVFDILNLVYIVRKIQHQHSFHGVAFNAIFKMKFTYCFPIRNFGLLNEILFVTELATIQTRTVSSSSWKIHHCYLSCSMEYSKCFK